MKNILRSTLMTLVLAVTIQTNEIQAQSVTGTAGSGGQDFTLSVCSDGSVMSVGDNTFGQLGNGSFTNAITFSAIPGFTSVEKVVACSTAVCAIKTDGTVWTWGDNNYGQLGDGTTTVSPVPIQITTLTGTREVRAGVYNFYALKNDSTVWAWGQNSSGNLGIGTTASTNVPLQVVGLTGVLKIIGSREFEHAHALKSDGTVWSWGNNSFGQLGDGTITDSNVPVQATGLTGVVAIGGNGNFVLALKNDGTVWAWGDNSSGQLGNGTNIGSTLPLQVTGLTGIVSIDGSDGVFGTYNSAHAIKNDGTVWAWGGNDYGQLGDGTFTDSNIPVQVSGLSNILAMSGGYLALKSDGTVWSWGYNYFGQLGNGSTTDTNTPVQLASLTGITQIAGFGNYSYAVEFDGTMHSWGWNIWGELGDGTTTDRTSPVTISNQCPPSGCVAYYTATYDSVSNNFTLTVDPLTTALAVSYSWDFGDGSAFSTLPNPSHAFAIDSVYNVCMEIFTATGDSCTYCHSIGIDAAGNIIRTTGFTMNVVNGSITTSISQTPVITAVDIFPNPSNGTFTVSGEISSLEVFNVLGEVVYSAFGLSDSINLIELTSAARGIYFVKTNNGTETKTQKIIVQ